MTTLEEDDDLIAAPVGDVLDGDDDAVEHDPNDTLVDVPDAEIVGDAVEMDGNEDVDLLTDGPYARTEEVGAETDGGATELVVPPARAKPSRRKHRAEMNNVSCWHSAGIQPYVDSMRSPRFSVSFRAGVQRSWM